MSDILDTKIPGLKIVKPYDPDAEITQPDHVYIEEVRNQHVQTRQERIEFLREDFKRKLSTHTKVTFTPEMEELGLRDEFARLYARALATMAFDKVLMDIDRDDELSDQGFEDFEDF